MTLITILFWIVAILAGLLILAHLWSRSQAAAAEAAIPRVGQTAQVRGGIIHYLDLGPHDARPLVMIHGLSGQLQHFTYSLTELLDGDFRLIVLDRPGCGYSTRDGEAMGTLAEQARMIWEFLDHARIENPLLVGHSLGGAVSLAMAVQRPDAVAGLALLCPATMPQTDVPPVFKGLEVRTGWLRRLIGQTIAVPMAKATQDKVLRLVSDPEPVPQDFMTRAGAMLGLRPGAYVTASEDLLGYEAAIDAQVARYGELTMPRAVLFGELDAVLSPEAHGKALQQYGFDYEELPARGHMFPLTRPGDTADFIRRMAARVN